MAKHEHSPGERWQQRRPRLILRWLARFLGRSVLVALMGLLLVGLIAFFAYINRARLVNNALSHLVEPFDVSVKRIDLYPIGEVRIEALTLSPRGVESETPLLSVPEVALTYNFQDLRNRRQLRTVFLQEPKIHLNHAHLTGLGGGEKDTTPEAAPLDLSKFSFFTESLQINNGKFTLDLKGIPLVEGLWDLRSGPFAFDEKGLLEDPVQLTLNTLTLGEEGKLGKIAAVSASAQFQKNLSRVDVGTVSVSGVNTEITPDWFASEKEKGETESTVAETVDTVSLETSQPIGLFFKSFVLGQSTFAITGFDGENEFPAIPDLAFETAIEFQELKFENGKWSSPAPLSLALSNVAIGPPTEQLASADRISIQTESLGALIYDRTISNLALEGLDVVMSDKTLTRCRKNSGRESEEESEAAEKKPIPPWIVQSLSISDGAFLMQETTFSATTAPRIETRISGHLRDLRFGGAKGFASEGYQEVFLEQMRLRAPGVEQGITPLLSFESADLAMNWTDFDFNNQIERLSIEGAKITFTDEALGSWLDENENEKTAPMNRPVYKVADLSLIDGTLEADSQFAKGRVPKVYSDFTIETEGAEPFSYLLSLDNFRLRNHPVLSNTATSNAPAPPTDPGTSAQPVTPVAEEDVITVGKIEVEATAEQLQRSRRIGKVRLSGALLQVGEGLKSIVETAPEEEAEEAAPAPPPATTENPSSDENAALPTWLLEEVQITQSQVRFDTLIPQVEGLEFAIETTLTDVPLSPDGLVAQDAMQKVELAGIEIKDPYNSFITVAFLPTIFVEFSLAGLARQEVEKIDLIAPALHVGQGLFWWIDYQRNFRAQNEGARLGFGEAGANAPEAEAEAEAGLEPPDWVIKTINATAGKIVIAPTGIPIGMVPFPFNATTNMSDGAIDLTLNIPDEDEYVYQFPDYKIDLYGLSGDVLFNVPVKSEDNNLWQHFRLDRIVWKKYEAQNVDVGVTFDANGIYGTLEGNAYGGYVNAGFNFYLNDRGKWDAWITGSGLESEPFTEILVPENFLMSGPLYLELVSEGRDKIPGKTTGEIQTLGPGSFDITKLNRLLENLPEEWSNLQRGLAELGISELKRFEYDKGAGSLYFEGREGNLDLRFTGPHGTRELNLQVHDNRNTKSLAENGDGTESAVAVSTETNKNATTNTNPIPEAAARPVSADR